MSADRIRMTAEAAVTTVGDGATHDAVAGSRVLDRVLAALADPAKRLLLKRLSTNGEVTASALAAPLPMTRQTVVEHLTTLDTAGLVAGRRVGDEVRYALRPSALDETATWLGTFAAARDDSRPSQAPP
jgi:DNA-binding transcriptional ArsR family regulator